MSQPDTIATWELLVRYHRQTTMFMDEHLRATFGHPLDDYDALHQIARFDGPIAMGELASRLVVANSSCHRIIGRLTDAGYVERRQGAVDRRQVFVQLTAEGKRLRRRMAAVHTRDIEHRFGAMLSTDEQRRLHTTLERLLAGGAEAEDPDGAGSDAAEPDDIS